MGDVLITGCPDVSGFYCTKVGVLFSFQAERDAEMSHALPNGVVTSAVPRPTAYVPLGEGDLPLPKPYGKHAPFKPSQSVGNLRHIRKPQPQPIDI